MVDISNISVDKFINNKNNQIIEASRTIELTYIKIKKAKRTYIYGLEYFITDQKKLLAFVKSLQSELATGMVNDEDDTGRKRFGFNGKHGEEIKNKLISLGIPSEKIECGQIS